MHIKGGKTLAFLQEQWPMSFQSQWHILIESTFIRLWKYYVIIVKTTKTQILKNVIKLQSENHLELPQERNTVNTVIQIFPASFYVYCMLKRK